MSQALHDTLDSKLISLNLLAMRDVYLNLSENMTKEQLGHIDYLDELTKIEIEQRHQKCVQQLLKLAKLPRNKLLLDFDITRIPGLHPGLVKNLSNGQIYES